MQIEQQQLKRKHMEYLWNKLKSDKSKKIAMQMISNKNQNISESLNQDILKICGQKELLIKKKFNFSDEQQRIRKKKLEITKQLQQLQQEQQKLKIRQGLQISLPVKRKISKQKSILTKEEIQKIKICWLQNKKFEQKLREKDQILKKKIEQQRQKELQKFQMESVQKKKLKIKSLQEKFKQLENRKNQRIKMKQFTSNQLKQYLNRKYLFTQLEQKHRQQQQREQRRKQQQYLLLKRVKSFSIDEIKEHNRKYIDIISRQKQERNRRLSQLKFQMKKKVNKKYPHTSFSEYVQIQQKKLKDKKKQKKQYLIKIQKFLLELKQKGLGPNNSSNGRKSSTKTVIVQSPKMINNKSLSFQQIKQRGNQYLQQSKKKRKKQQIKQQKLIQKQQQKSNKNTKINYLKQFKPKSDLSQIYIKKIKNLLNNKTKNFYDIQQATNFANKLQNMAGNNDQNLLRSIQTKLEILQHIQ